MTAQKFCDGFMEAARQARYQAQFARRDRQEMVARALEAFALALEGQAENEDTDPRFSLPPPPVPRGR